MSAERRPLLRGTARSSVRLWLQKIRDCLADIPRLHLSVSWVHGSLPPKRSQPGNESIPDKISRWIASVAPGAGYSVTISDVQRRIVWVNDSFTRMTGYTLSEFRNRKFSEVLYFEGTDAQTVKHVREAFAGGRAVCFELLVRGKDGQQWWLYTDAQPLLDSAGVLEGWVCIQADVTAQVRIREAARAAEIALKLSEAKFRSLFDHSTVAFAMTDVSTGQFLEANRAFAMCTGYTREELLQMTFWDLTTAEGMPSTAKQIENIKGTRQYGPFEKAYRRKDGSHVPVLINGVPLTDAAGRDFMWTVVQDISNLKSMEAELIRAARHDKLTGLANRALFMQRLQEALDRVRSSQQRLFAVLFLDFDRFKLVNDTLGHSAGDELLRQISGRLRGALRSTDACCNDSNGNLVARMGGDEFLILINDLRAPKDAGRIAERLLETLASAYDIFGAPVHSTASIGIVTSDQCEQDAGAVVRNADVAMYEAKRAGRACSVVFSEAMHQRVTRYAMIETSLRQAIGTPDFYLAYQPIVELDTGRMVSVEALARWDHPKFGSIAPSEFIPIAEESGLIIAVGEWVLRQACQAMRGWMTQDPARAPMMMSVNVSRAELALGRMFVERVISILRETGLEPQRLQLEITEREIMREPKCSLEALRQFRLLGVKIAMDDFGTGTSSLACLRDYPLDTVKIDRSFLISLATSREVLALIHATLLLIDNLGMTSVAEGVEETSQLAVLQSLGCNYAQGYLFSRPVRAEQLIYALEGSAAARVTAVA